MSLYLWQLFGEQTPEQVDSDLAAVVEFAFLAPYPLPDLRTGDLGRRGVFHEVEHRDTTVAHQPGAEILDADGNIVAQARFGNRTLRLEIEQILGPVVHVGQLLIVLVGRRHMLVEHFLRNRHQRRVRHPRAVATVGDFAELVLAHFFEGGLVGYGIVLDRNLCGHSAHGRGASLVAGFHQRKRISAHER